MAAPQLLGIGDFEPTKAIIEEDGIARCNGSLSKIVLFWIVGNVPVADLVVSLGSFPVFCHELREKYERAEWSEPCFSLTYLGRSKLY